MGHHQQPASAATGDTSGEDVQGALDAFVSDRGQALLRFAFLLTGGRAAEAEDLVQTVLTRLVDRGLGGLDDPLAYARRGILNEQRSLARHSEVQRRTHPRLVEPDAGSTPGPEERMTVFAALRELGERERAAVVLRYYEDLPDQQIAEALGCSRATVRSLVHRALPKLRARLDDEAAGPGRTDEGTRP